MFYVRACDCCSCYHDTLHDECGSVASTTIKSPYVRKDDPCLWNTNTSSELKYPSALSHTHTLLHRTRAMHREILCPYSDLVNNTRWHIYDTLCTYLNWCTCQSSVFSLYVNYILIYLFCLRGAQKWWHAAHDVTCIDVRKEKQKKLTLPLHQSMTLQSYQSSDRAIDARHKNV